MFSPQAAARAAEDNDTGNAPETLRRQQMMRFGLIIFLLFLMLDNKQQQPPPGNRTSGGGGSSAEKSTYAEIPVNAVYSAKINEILALSPHTEANQQSMNGTGLYRGSWNSLQTYGNSSDSNGHSGSALLQLVSVPVRAARGVSYVYGLLHLYRDVHKQAGGSVSVSLEAGFPLQGVLVSSQQKLVLFSTPYKSQRLYLRLGSSQHFNDSAPLSPPASASASVSTGGSGASGTLRIMTNSKAGGGGLQARQRRRKLREVELLRPAELLEHHAAPALGVDEALALSGADLLQDIVRRLLSVRAVAGGTAGEPAQRRLSSSSSSSTQPLPAALLQALGIASVQPAQAREVKLTPSTAAGYLSVMLTDQPLQPTSGNSSTNSTNNTSSPSANNVTTTALNHTDQGESSAFLVSLALGEPLLPARFKALQSSATPPSLVITLQPNRSSSTSTSTSRAYSPADCQYTLQLAATSESSASTTDPAQVSLPVPIQPEPGTQETTEATAAEPSPPTDVKHSPPATKPKALEPVLQVDGAVTSPNCGKAFSLHVTAFNLELDTLKSKVDLYALVTTFLCLSQVFLVVFQMKHASTQALVSRVSIVSVFAQSLLDANLCMAHLLLCFAFPSVFFASFIWIAVVKLLLFSVFQMRLIISIYQARYAQELSAEGWQGLRSRLIALHVRFYGAVLLILFVSVVFYSRPVVAVLALYSFWVPQIFHSAYSGTKHSLHPLYLIGTTLTRCFIPLYVLGCPKNFLAMLSIYINPQYLAVLSDAAISNAVSSSSGSLQDLPAANVSACWVLVLWLCAQVGVLLLQSAFGPRFFVPKRFLPQRYDYKRAIPGNVRAALVAAPSPATASTSAASGPDAGSRDSSGDIAMTGIRSRGQTAGRGSTSSGGLQALLFGPRSSTRAPGDAENEEDLETGSLLGSHRDGQATGAAQGIPDRQEPSGTAEAECVICYNAIHLTAGSDYMITPCDHLFHEHCLVQWADVKLECPVCRAALPALGEDLH